jgi:hypothetical protein
LPLIYWSIPSWSTIGSHLQMLFVAGEGLTRPNRLEIEHLSETFALDKKFSYWYSICHSELNHLTEGFMVGDALEAWHSKFRNQASLLKYGGERNGQIKEFIDIDYFDFLSLFQSKD